LFRRLSRDPRAFRGGPRKLETYFGCARGPASVRRSRGPRTRAVHGPRRRKPGPLVTPIFASSTWALASARQGADFAVDTAPPAYYTRWGNPTVRELEDVLADLEGGARALATGSGMGALAYAILTSVDRGDYVVAGGSRSEGEARTVRPHMVRVQDARAGPRSVRGVPRPAVPQDAPPPDGGPVEHRAIARRVPRGPPSGPRGPLSRTAVVSATRSGE